MNRAGNKIRILVLTLATTLAHNLWEVPLPKWGSLFICKYGGWMRGVCNISQNGIQTPLLWPTARPPQLVIICLHLQFHHFSIPCSFTKFQLHQSSFWSSNRLHHLYFRVYVLAIPSVLIILCFLTWLVPSQPSYHVHSSKLSFPRPYYLKIIGPVSHFHGLFSLMVLSGASLWSSKTLHFHCRGCFLSLVGHL